jgi:hypothetical protein
MLPFYNNVSTLIPFSVDDLIDISCVEILETVPSEDNFVHKQSLPPEVLTQQFLEFLNERDLGVSKVLVWTWLCKDPHIAHIDCNDKGEILPAAFNFTMNTNKSDVRFYDMPDVDKTVMTGNQADTEWKTDNVQAYIPVNVKNVEPAAVWDDRGPCLINTSVPHLIVAPEIRTSISLQFNKSETIEILLQKLSS